MGLECSSKHTSALKFVGRWDLNKNDCRSSHLVHSITEYCIYPVGRSSCFFLYCDVIINILMFMFNKKPLRLIAHACKECAAHCSADSAIIRVLEASSKLTFSVHCSNSLHSSIIDASSFQDLQLIHHLSYKFRFQDREPPPKFFTTYHMILHVLKSASYTYVRRWA